MCICCIAGWVAFMYNVCSGRKQQQDEISGANFWRSIKVLMFQLVFAPVNYAMFRFAFNMDESLLLVVWPLSDGVPLLLNLCYLAYIVAKLKVPKCDKGCCQTGSVKANAPESQAKACCNKETRDMEPHKIIVDTKLSGGVSDVSTEDSMPKGSP
eukprot:gnl/MRDRNA2_/MRDRNA2_70511_c0_seq1.p1 gnl/MRDRNA2_/MRDRNA2_70511_c0~~gnl/MRDRNA2_/MRDRNA2_70511_c0_seq1.p1  ORF type:complete len:155 (+),score=19.17 gnl/MRDRNA2_/MRDRNA2_70511_c0_seq1:78-542(+)